VLSLESHEYVANGKVGKAGPRRSISSETKHRSNVYPIVQDDLSRNSTDRDVHYECIGEMGA